MFGIYKYVEIYTKNSLFALWKSNLACLFTYHCELVFHIALECAVAACRNTTSRSGDLYRKEITAEQTRRKGCLIPTAVCFSSWLSAIVSCIRGMRQNILGTWIGRNRCARGTENWAWRTPHKDHSTDCQPLTRIYTYWPGSPGRLGSIGMTTDRRSLVHSWLWFCPLRVHWPLVAWKTKKVVNCCCL